MGGETIEPVKSATPFELGRAAGRGLGAVMNPFSTGTVQHHNFEIGRASGAALAGPIEIPDPSESFFHRLD